VGPIFYRSVVQLLCGNTGHLFALAGQVTDGVKMDTSSHQQALGSLVGPLGISEQPQEQLANTTTSMRP
jgi:hypothetical protein